MKLGNVMHIVRGVTNYEETIPFYSSIGFKLLEEGISPIGSKFSLFTDGIINIVITEDKMTYTGLIYFDKSQQSRVERLENQGISFFWKLEKDDMPFQGMFEVIPNIFGINLVEDEYNEQHLPSGSTISPYGKFGEFSIAVQNLDEMEAKLLDLGFETTLKESKPYPWGIFRDGLITLGVHQTDDFEVPTITYFDEEMEKKLPSLSEKGIEFHKFAGMDVKSGNAKVIAPDGQEFLFLKGKV